MVSIGEGGESCALACSFPDAPGDLIAVELLGVLHAAGPGGISRVGLGDDLDGDAEGGPLPHCALDGEPFEPRGWDPYRTLPPGA